MLNSSDNEFSKLPTRKWYVIDSESKCKYSHHNPKIFLTMSIESSICDYSDAFILVTGSITVTCAISPSGNNPIQKIQPLATATHASFKNSTM